MDTYLIIQYIYEKHDFYIMQDWHNEPDRILAGIIQVNKRAKCLKLKLAKYTDFKKKQRKWLRTCSQAPALNRLLEAIRQDNNLFVFIHLGCGCTT